MGGRVREVTVVLGQMDVAQQNYPSQEVSYQCTKQLGRIPPAGGGRQLPGATQVRLCPVAVDDIHQARIS